MPPSAAQPAAPQSQGDPTTAPTQEPSQPNTEASPSPDASPADGWAVTEDDIDQAKLLIPAERQPQAAAPAEAIKRASLAAPAGLRAPSSLALGAAVASTKESISLRPVSPRSVQGRHGPSVW